MAQPPRSFAFQNAGAALAVLFSGLVWVGCGPSSQIDPRCSVEADPEHYTWLVKRINRSKLWRAYLEHSDPSRTRRLVGFRLHLSRRTGPSLGGDYDPGTVTVKFSATDLAKGKTLFRKQKKVDLPPFQIGLFDKEASREEIQKIVFKETEENVYPFLGRWVEISALRAIAQEGDLGGDLVPLLEKLLTDGWTSDDMRFEARTALGSIQGRS